MTVAKNKKVGIMTFHRAVNVGSFLQAYAMVAAVKSLGFQPEIIDYYSTRQQQQYDKIYLNNVRRRSIKLEIFLAVYSLALLPFAGKIRRYKHDHHAFLEKHLPISRLQYNHTNDLKSSQLKYGIYISGSDQIWNTEAVDFSEAYLLNFIEDARKIAYAPSLGNSSYFSKQHINELTRYDHLSVREKAGAQYVSKMMKRDVPSVLDPTFLLKKSDYAEIEQTSGIEGGYLFYYAIGYNIKQRIIVNKIARKHGLKVVSWNPQQYVLDKLFIRNLAQPKVQNPGVWLGLIKSAELVVTSSFHGSVFSVIYGKAFSILPSKKNNRLEIFNELGISYESSQGGKLPEVFKLADINAKQLQKLKNSSVDFLQSALKGGAQ